MQILKNRSGAPEGGPRPSQEGPWESSGALLGAMGEVWMVKSLTRACPRGPTKPPEKSKKELFVILEGQMHIFPTFFDGRPCEFERSLGGLGDPQGRPGASLGAPELALGRLGGVLSERAPHSDAPRGGLGTHFCDPMECACSPNAHICEVF